MAMTGPASHKSQDDHVQFFQSQRLPIVVQRTIAMTVVVLALTGLLPAAVIVWQVNQQAGQTRFLRLASRQRTLAEEVTVNALEVARLPNDSADRIVHQQAITTAITTLDRVQSGLASGDAELDLAAPSTQAVKDLVLVAGGPFARLKTNANVIAKTEQSSPIAAGDVEALTESNQAFQTSTIPFG